MIGCCTIWGLSPLYYKLLADIPPGEVLAHRTLWSLVFFAIVLGVQRRLHEVLPLLRPGRTLVRIGIASVMISANWFLFIFAVQVGLTMESSLGYYIFPLVAVLVGRVVFGETLGMTRWLAVGLAALAVLQLSIGLDAAPWIALALAGTFTIYGALKKSIAAGPVLSVTTEVLLLAPFALCWLWLGVPGWGRFRRGAGRCGPVGTRWFADRRAADPVFLCLPAVAHGHRGAAAISQSDIAVSVRNAGIRRTLHAVAYDCVCPNLDRAGDLFGRRAQIGPQERQYRWHVSGDLNEIADVVAGKSFGNHVVDQAQQGVPVAVDIQQQDRLGMQTQLAPGEHLEEFVQRPRAPRAERQRHPHS